MNKRRLELHSIFVTILGSRNVYFQPPSTIKMKYPCIIYNRSNANTTHANDRLYNLQQGYQVIIIDPNPDSEIPSEIAKLPYCRFDRHYTADNLNHDVYTIYY